MPEDLWKFKITTGSSPPRHNPKLTWLPEDYVDKLDQKIKAERRKMAISIFTQWLENATDKHYSEKG